ncbi:MAG: choice-of-anchor J domain-containing protein, partial [Muribaculaceae bacterium]
MKSALTLALAAMVAGSAVGQQRSAHGYVGSNRRAVTPTESSATHSIIRTDVHPLGTPTRSHLHQVSTAMPQPRRAAAPLRVLGDGTTIYGSLIYSTDWSGTSGNYGLYSFEASAYSKPTLVKDFNVDANGGGCYGNGKYYFNSYVYTDEMGYTFSTFYTHDLATGETTHVINSFMQENFDQSQIIHDMTFDPTTGTIFAAGYIKEVIEEGIIEKFYPSISTVDPSTGLVTPIARTPQFIAVACNRSGDLYGISKGMGSALYRINKETGSVTEIGPTGLEPDYVQSATFDPVTDRLYWTACLSNGRTGLYEVNITTGAASKIYDFGANEEFAGIYVPDPSVADGAPAAASGLAAHFANGAASGSFTFYAPTTTYGGAALTSNVTVTAKIDGAEAFSAEVAPGALVTVDATLEEGVHNFTVTAANAAGSGVRVGLSTYVGIDAPAEVGNLTVTADKDDNAVISWTAPTRGRNDGYLDASQLNYTVIRQPEGLVVARELTATTFTDNLTTATGRHYYTVVPYCDFREGLAADTGWGLFGVGTSVPCHFGFDTRDDYDLFTVIDANNDFDAQYNWGSWLYALDFKYSNVDGNGAAIYGYSPENDADDWLITPAFLTEAGKKYRLTFDMWTRGQSEILTVTAGTRNTIDAQSAIIPTTTYNHKERQTFTTEFTAETTGNYYVGFHITSSKKSWYLLVDDIKIDEVPNDAAPAAVADAVVTPAAEGALQATVSFTAPTTTVSGATLSSLSVIAIYRGNDPDQVAVFQGPTPGQRYEWVDNYPVNGINTYRIVAYNDAIEAGAKAECSAWVGVDEPMVVEDVVFTAEGNHPCLTWCPPTDGVHGGYINPDALYYVILRNDGQNFRTAVGENMFTDTSIDGSDKQHYLRYAIWAVSTAGSSDYVLTDDQVFGDPYTTEFAESFTDQTVSTDPWTLHIVKGKNQLWGLYSMGYSPYCSPVDGDGGLATFSSSEATMGDACRMITPKYDLSGFGVPLLSFYFYHCPSEDALYGEDPYQDRLIPEVMLPDGSFVALSEPIYVDDPTAYEGWYQYTLDLTPYKNQPWVRFSFHGIADYENDVNIDLIELTDAITYDLEVYTFNGPARIKAGKEAFYAATVHNVGIYAAESYSVVLLRNGEEISRQAGRYLAPDGFASYEFCVSSTLDDEGKTHRYSVKIEYADDVNLSNNTSGEVLTTYTAPDVPQVHTLTGSANGSNVLLSWDAANALRVADSFEDYTAFSIDNIGDYTLVDGDKGYTYGFADIYFEHSGEPCAYMVFNPGSLGLTMLPEARANTGEQVLAAFSSVDASGSAIQNDDWLISPRIFGGQTIT